MDDTIATQWDAAQAVLAQLVTTDEAARRKGVTRWQINKWIDQNKVLGKRIGRAWLVFAPSLEQVQRSPKGRPHAGEAAKTRKKTHR